MKKKETNTMKNDFEKNLEMLSLLTEAFLDPTTLEEGLNHITKMTCSLMGTEQAVFLDRDEERQELIVRSVVGIDSPNVKPNHRLLVPEKLHRILWKCHHMHQVGKVEAGIEGIMFPIIINPIVVKKSRVGLLIAGGPKNKETTTPYDSIRRKLFSLIAPIASLVYENSRMYDIVDQKINMSQSYIWGSPELFNTNLSEAGDKRAASEQLILNLLRDPNKVVAKVADTFFRELAKFGFTAANITTAAAHILDCLTKSEIDPATGRVILNDDEDDVPPPLQQLLELGKEKK